MQKIIHTGIIGFGTAGRVFHAPFISTIPYFHLAKIRTSNDEAIKLAKVAYPKTEIVSGSKSIFEDPGIELVVIGTPDTTHFSLAKEALLSGKHVIVEKPFTITSAEADELIGLAEKQNKILTVNHNRRWDSDFKTVKKVLAGNLPGRLVEYEAHFDRFRPILKKDSWKEENVVGTGILYGLGSHLIDQALQLFGMPKQITADIRIQREGGKTDDNVELILDYPGLKVTLKAGMLVKQPGPHFILLSDRGSFIKYGMDIQEEALKSGLNPATTPDWGKEPENLWGQIDIDSGDQHFIGNIESEKGSYQDFFINAYKAIIGDEDLIVKPGEARNVIRIIELAYQSNREKRSVSYSG